MLAFLRNKLLYEAEGIAAIARYATNATEILDKLSRSMPSLSIETTNICNANCVFCGYQYQQRPTGVMSDTLFRKLVTEFAECGGGGLGLTPTVGDPLVDPQIAERISWAKTVPGVTRIGMYSNMISLARIGARRLVRSGLDELIVSTSGFDAEMYQRVYRSKVYGKMIENVKAFARENNAVGRPVAFRISCRIDRPIRDVTASSDFQDVAALVGTENIDFKFRFDSWAGKIKARDLPRGMKLRSPAWFRRPRISPCSEMYTGPIAYWDGRVGACACRDVDASELIIGDANTTHLGDIWFGEELKKLRREFLTNKVRDICKSCTHYCNASNFLRRGSEAYLAQPPSPRWTESQLGA